MNQLPEDLVQYLRFNRLGDRQKVLIKELASEHRKQCLTSAEYADRYVKRSMRIARALGGSLIPYEN